MPYASIAVHINHSERCKARVALGATLARRFGAHLIGVAATGLATLSTSWGAGELGYYYADVERRQKEMCAGVIRAFDEQVDRAGVDSFEHRLLDDEDMRAMALSARYADLVIIGQNSAQDPTIGTGSNFDAEVVINAGRPVLVVPYAGSFDAVGNDVLICWDASREAARAVADALPFLAAADRVRLLVVNASPTVDGHGAEPGADVAIYLARHGVKVEVVQERTELEVSIAILNRAADYGSDLIVMGAYGHSRFREMLLGGATRAILDTMTAPVLLSH